MVIAEIDKASGDAAARSIRDSGGDAFFVQTDVSNETQVKAVVQLALERYGKIDVLCNNAAVLLIHEEARAHELTNETWDRTMAVNLRGYWLCSKYVIPAMLRQGGGSIIHVASPTGLFGFTRLTAYSTSKGGVVGLMRAMAADYAPDHHSRERHRSGHDRHAHECRRACRSQKPRALCQHGSRRQARDARRLERYRGFPGVTGFQLLRRRHPHGRWRAHGDLKAATTCEAEINH